MNAFRFFFTLLDFNSIRGKIVLLLERTMTHIKKTVKEIPIAKITSSGIAKKEIRQIQLDIN